MIWGETERAKEMKEWVLGSAICLCFVFTFYLFFVFYIFYLGGLGRVGYTDFDSYPITRPNQTRQPYTEPPKNASFLAKIENKKINQQEDFGKNEAVLVTSFFQWE